MFNVNNLFKKEYGYISNNYSKYKKGFSGTLSVTKISPCTESHCTKIDYRQDGRVIKYKYDKLIIFNVYFPNGKRNKNQLEYKLEFYKIFLEYCSQLRKEGYSLIICGDFNTTHTNLDLKKGKIHSTSGFSKIEQDLFQAFLDLGFIDTFRYINGNVENAYTLFPYRSKAREKNEGWRVDYILISEDLKFNLKDAFILDSILGSDHCPIGISIDLKGFL